MAQINNSQTWGLTIDEFDNALYGNEIGQFKATNDLLKKYQVVKTDGSIDMALFDGMFHQLATAIVYRFAAKIDYLKLVKFTDMPIDYQREIRYAVYKELSNGMKNDIFERRLDISVSTAGFDENNDLSGWTIPADAISIDTWERLEHIIGIYDYEIIDGSLYYKGEVYDPSFKTGQKLSLVELIGTLRKIYTTDQVDDIIAKKLASNKSFIGVFDTTDITNMTVEYDTFLKALAPQAQDGSSAEIRYVNAADPSFDGITESYTFVSGAWIKATTNYQSLQLIMLLEGQIQGLYDNKAWKQDVLLKDGSTEISDPNYNPTGNKITTAQIVQQWLATQKAAILGNNATKTMTDVESLITDLQQRMTTVENNPSASFISAFREWTGNNQGTAIANGKTFDLTTLTPADGKPFEIVAGREFTGYLLGSVNGVNKRIPFKAVVAAPDATIQEITSSREWDATISAAGVLTFTATGAGQAILDVSTLQLFAVYEYVLQNAQGVALKNDLTVLNASIDNKLNNKLDRILAGGVFPAGMGTNDVVQAIISNWQNIDRASSNVSLLNEQLSYKKTQYTSWWEVNADGTGMPVVNDGSHSINLADYQSFLNTANNVGGDQFTKKPLVEGGYVKMRFLDGSMFFGQVKTLPAAGANTPSRFMGVFTSADATPKVETGILTFTPSTGSTFTKAFAAGSGGGDDTMGKRYNSYNDFAKTEWRAWFPHKWVVREGTLRMGFVDWDFDTVKGGIVASTISTSIEIQSPPDNKYSIRRYRMQDCVVKYSSFSDDGLNAAEFFKVKQ